MVISYSLQTAKMFSIWHSPAIMISQRKEKERASSLGRPDQSEGDYFRQLKRLFPLLSLAGTNNSIVAEALKKQSAEYPRVMSVAG